MSEWFQNNPAEGAYVALGAAIVALILLVLLIIVFVAWRRQRAARIRAEAEAREATLSQREQGGRLRIVRELHDVAAHSLNSLVRQAEGAGMVSQTDAAAVSRAASSIADSARAALADLRRVVAVIREGEADVSPQPYLKSARDLFKVMREAGLVINYQETGQRFPLQRAAELAVYSVLQESLSNAAKYGGEGTEVRIVFAWRGESLQLTIDDDGLRAKARREGLDPNELSKTDAYGQAEDLEALTAAVVGPGIAEMRQRVAIFGGVLHAFPVPGVGFSVSAAFPNLRYNNGVHGVKLSNR